MQGFAHKFMSKINKGPWYHQLGRCLVMLCGSCLKSLMKSFDELFAEISEKAATRPSGSETVKWLDAGVHTIGKKVVEEAAEVWMAAEYEGNERTAEEISQLIYHLQVMMAAKGISLKDLEKFF